MEIKLKINTDKILAETGITIEEPEQVLGEDISDTAINDVLWFERDTIAEWCGFSSWEALENGEEEEEEKTEEEEEENNFSRWCKNQSHDCSGCPYQKMINLNDCERAYYHNNPDDDDGIRLYQ